MTSSASPWFRGWVVMMVACSAGRAADVRSLEALRAEYLKALPVLEAKFDHCGGEGLFSTFKKSEGKGLVTKQSWISFEMAGGRGRLVKTNIASLDRDSSSVDLVALKAKLPSESQSVSAYNGKYSFHIINSPKGFLVRSLENGDKVGRSTIDNLFGRIVHAATDADNWPISKYLGKENFHLERVTPVGPDADSPLRLEFTRAFNSKAAPASIQITSGWFVVSPAAQWMVNEIGLVHTPTSRRYRTTSVGHVAYQPGQDGQLLPAKVDFRKYDGEYQADPSKVHPGIEPFFGEDFRFAEFHFGDAATRDFTLSAFGLPEFDQTVAQAAAARSFPWWLLGSAAGFGVLAFALRRLSRRGFSAPNPEIS